MQRTIHRFSIAPGVPIHEVEETLLLSLYGAEGIHGAVRVRLDAGYSVDEMARTLVVDASTPVGETVVQLFTGYLTRGFGEDSFLVECVGVESTDPLPKGGSPAEVAR